MSDPVIAVENLSKRYTIHHKRDGDGGLRHAIHNFATAPLRWLRSPALHASPAVEEFWALRNVSFEIKRGELVGIIGRNGAGKSTLLKVLSRITQPTEGRVRIKGNVASLLEVGTGFHPELTGEENIHLNGAILGMTRRQIIKKFDEIVAFAEVEKFLDTPVKRYSSGMYVRLAFAVAAHLDPEILIVDEVLAVGDAEFQRKCLGKMRTVASENRTVLFVSHNLQAIERLCTRGILMQEGSLLDDGPIAHVCERYVSSMKTWSPEKRLELRPREGNNQVRITDLEVLNAEGRPVSRISAGDPLLVRIHYFAQKPISLPQFGFAVLTAAGTRIFNTLSNDAGAEINCIKGRGSIDLRIEGLTLAIGYYLCNLAIGDDRGAYYDHLTEVPFVDVVESGKLPQSRTYDQHSGVIFSDSKWSSVKHESPGA